MISPKLFQSPQNEREQIAKAVRIARKKEARNRNLWRTNYIVDRTLSHYEEYFPNLETFLNEVSKSSQKTVLDIGSGITSGIFGIYKKYHEKFPGLTFKATTLSYDPRIKNNLGTENTHITSVESLSRIGDGEVGGFLAVMSLQFMTSPRLAAKQISRVLAPDGRGVFIWPTARFPKVNRLITRITMGVNINYNPREFILELEKCGIEVKKIDKNVRVRADAKVDIFSVKKI